MEITDSTFENNQCTEFCIHISTNENTDTNTNYTTIEKTIFKRNTGIMISLEEKSFISTVKFDENEFTQNEGQAIVIRYGNVVDINSKYISN